MGRVYANVTLLGVALDDARPACPRPSFVAADGPHVVVFAEDVPGDGRPQVEHLAP